MKRRIIAGMGANSFGMAVTIGIQLLSLPFFLHYWSTSTYGTWLMLSAIPAYLSMADIGMVTAVGNKMTMAMGKGEVLEANKLFQSAQLFMTIVCSLIALLTLPVILFAPFTFLSSVDMRIAIAVLGIGVLVALFGGLSEAVFKSTQRYAKGTLLSNLVRLGEWIGCMLGLMMVGSFAAVALFGLVARLIGTLISIQLSKRGNHGIHWGIHDAEATEIRSMIKPAISFMVFPLSNALSFQGLTLLVGAIFGPVTVALFNTYRTIARVAVQITAIFSHALWPEFSRLFGEGAIVAVRHVFRRSAILGAAQALVISLLLYFVAPWLLKFWTHGEIEFNATSMLLMLLYAAVGGIWHIPRVLLMATNQHTNLAYWALAAAVLSIALAWLLSSRLQLNGVVLGMLLSEVFIAVACAWLAYAAIIKAGTHSHQNRKAILQ